MDGWDVIDIYTVEDGLSDGFLARYKGIVLTAGVYRKIESDEDFKGLINFVIDKIKEDREIKNYLARDWFMTIDVDTNGLIIFSDGNGNIIKMFKYPEFKERVKMIFSDGTLMFPEEY